MKKIKSAQPFSPENLKTLLHRDFKKILARQKSVAVAVSGGPDSMALCYLLRCALPAAIKIHALTVDHGLRPESAAEAAQAAAIVKSWDGVTHKTLKWRGQKPETRLMEAARAARYALMQDYCTRHGIKCLFLAHHQDDQAETFLLRLAGGSGLDGLAGIAAHRRTENGLYLLRPLLTVPKADLVATCRANGVAFIKDPSNARMKYARPRLRRSQKILAAEGLDAKRLSVTAMRLSRARQALDTWAENAFKSALKKPQTKNMLSLDALQLKSLPPEISLRVLMMAIDRLRPNQNHRPRMERIEALHTDLMDDNTAFRKRTLGGLVFEMTRDGAAIRIAPEK